jgi:hypothetical protein
VDNWLALSVATLLQSRPRPRAINRKRPVGCGCQFSRLIDSYTSESSHWVQDGMGRQSATTSLSLVLSSRHSIGRSSLEADGRPTETCWPIRPFDSLATSVCNPAATCRTTGS